MTTESKPDLVVGIDLGQTCTGVAYNNLTYGSDNIRWIQKWPGRSQSNENKVPTTLVYPHGHDQPSSWGFLAESPAEQSPEHGTVREWFKTLLDPDNLLEENERNPSHVITHEDVRRWFRDYLSRIHDNIKARLQSELPNFGWTSGKIEFLFSVPTTWDVGIVEQFKEVIGQAGFGGPANATHTVTISLTEPEAAAVYTSTAASGIFKEDDVLVVCDAGGGTTDLSVLKVTDTVVGALSLKQLRQLDVVGGENIGSAAIDYEFELLARARLREANSIATLGLDAEECAWEMSKSNDFQNAKCDYGAADNSPTFSVPVPAIANSYSNSEVDLVHGQMMFQKEDLRTLFDRQIDKIFKLIDHQLNTLHQRLPNEVVGHLVLSGGLGQSPYVQMRLRDRYGEGSYIYPNAQTMQVRVAPDPQLAVCKGLIADRLRKLTAGQSVLGWRCCRASYGLLCREYYDKNNAKHFNRNPEKDPLDGVLYVNDCVDWFVVKVLSKVFYELQYWLMAYKGTPVSIEQPTSHKFRRKISPGDPRRVFPTRVVVSYREKQDLPHHMQAGVERLCDVESDFSSVDEKRFKEKNKKFWQIKDAYYEVLYDIKVIIGPADLRFELWFDGEKFSKDNSIKVEWAHSTAPSTAVMVPPPLIHQDAVLKKKPASRFQRMLSSPPPSPGRNRD